MVGWLERLSYGAESRRKIVQSNPFFAIRKMENSICQPSSKWVPFSNQSGKDQETIGERWASTIHLLCPRYGGP